MEDFTNENELLSRIMDGNIVAFELVYKKYSKELYIAAYKRLKRRDHAEDIVQEIFTQLWNKREELKIENLSAYLHTCVRNKVFNLFEKEKRYVSYEDLLLNNLNQYGERADALALRNEFLKSYHALLESLPPKQQLIFKLSYYDGSSTKEIAQRLNISRKTVQNQLARAVTHLRHNLSQVFILLLILLFSCIL